MGKNINIKKTETQSMMMGSSYDFTKVQTDPTMTIRNNNIKQVYKTKIKSGSYNG